MSGEDSLPVMILSGWCDDLSAEIEVEAEEQLQEDPSLQEDSQDDESMSHAPSSNASSSYLLPISSSATQSSTSPSSICKWRFCDYAGLYDDLVDHIREIHVKLQPYLLPDSCLPHVISNCSNQVPSPPSSSDAASSCSNDSSNVRPSTEEKSSYVCLWEGCKVFNVPSKKLSWLESHIFQKHLNGKIHKCIIGGCEERFKDQVDLQKHVHSHFKTVSKDVVGSSSSICLNSDGSSEHGSDDLNRRTNSSGKGRTGSTNGPNSLNGTPNKVAKKKKPTRVRKVIVRGCSEDFFDSSVMEVIQYRLFQLQQITGPRSVKHISLQSTVSVTCSKVFTRLPSCKWCTCWPYHVFLLFSEFFPWLGNCTERRRSWKSSSLVDMEARKLFTWWVDWRTRSRSKQDPSSSSQRVPMYFPDIEAFWEIVKAKA